MLHNASVALVVEASVVEQIVPHNVCILPSLPTSAMQSKLIKILRTIILKKKSKLLGVNQI